MRLLTSPSTAFPAALIYITLGTLIDVWCIVTYLFYRPDTDWGNFWLIGFMATGFALLVIGLFLGQIGRAARNAELPPAEVTADVAQAEKKAADHPPPIVAPGVGGGMQPMAATQPGAPQPYANPAQAMPPAPPTSPAPQRY